MATTVSVSVTKAGFTSRSGGAFQATANTYIGRIYNVSAGHPVDMTRFTLRPASNATSMTVTFTMAGDAPVSYAVKYAAAMPADPGDGGMSISIGKGSGNSITLTGTFSANTDYILCVWGDTGAAAGSYACTACTATGEYEAPPPVEDGGVARVRSGGAWNQYVPRIRANGAWGTYEPYVYYNGGWRKMV